MKITAAICTHNRVAYLPDAIESLLRQNLPASDYEILVIDNCSTDATPDIVEHCLATPGAVVLRSARTELLGLSHARNLAVQLAAGEIVAFLDDDAIAAPQWLAALLDVYASNPGVWAVGGKVLPQWEGQRPDWLTDDLLPQLSMLNLGDTVRRLALGEELYGANCSFRRCVFETLGTFRIDLGRQGAHLLGSEESELQQRIRRHGKYLIYSPHAVVHHRVMAERLQPRYFVQLAYGKGRTRARLVLADTPCTYGLLKRIWWGWLGVVWGLLLLGLHPCDKRIQLRCMRRAAHWFGFVWEVIGEKQWKDL